MLANKILINMSMNQETTKHYCESCAKEMNGWASSRYFYPNGICITSPMMLMPMGANMIQIFTDSNLESKNF